MLDTYIHCSPAPSADELSVQVAADTAAVAGEGLTAPLFDLGNHNRDAWVDCPRQKGL